MNRRHSYPLLAGLSLTTALLLSGCAGTAKSSSGDKSSDSEYTYVTETGSYIPKRVKKGEVSDGSQNIEKVGAAAAGQMSEEQVRKATVNLNRTQGG